MKIFASLFLVLSFTASLSYSQNAFYDAQILASITPRQQEELEEKSLDKELSDEETLLKDQILDFIKRKDDEFFTRSLSKNDVLDYRSIVGLLEKVKKIAEERRLIELAKGQLSGFKDSSPGSIKSSLLQGLGSTAQRLGSADFQTALIDITATYIAESFKEDMTYMFFSRFKRRLDSIPELKYLLPQTYGVIVKINPFNFKDLGSSWKVAFEKDIQNLPVNFSTFVKSSPNRQWSRKISSSPYFKYYEYSLDFLTPLTKGQHPAEILELLNKKYYSTPTAEIDKFKSLVHFTWMLQSNLQDTAINTSADHSKNIWISFNQLKNLNTAKKRKYFCALLYLRNEEFFKSDPLGSKLKSAIAGTEEVQKQFTEKLSSMLILLNQVEGGLKEIKESKKSNIDTKEITRIYLKNVLTIADSTCSFIKGFQKDIKELKPITDEIDKYLKFGNNAYNLYADITAKNYIGVINQTTSLLIAFDQKGGIISSSVIETLTKADAVKNHINAIKVLIKDSPLTVEGLADSVLSSMNVYELNPQEVTGKIKNATGYHFQDEEVKKQLDPIFLKIEALIYETDAALAKLTGTSSFNSYVKVLTTLNTYGKVVASIARAENSEDLKNVIRNYIATPASFAVQRTAINSISIATHVGLTFGAESNQNLESFKPNFGLSVPLGFEFARANRSTRKTDLSMMDDKEKLTHLTGASTSLYVQLFDLAAAVNYRLGNGSDSELPQKILLKQVFSPGLTINFGLKNTPFNIGFGGQYTPQLRKIGEELEANSIRLFMRLSWGKPLIFLRTKRENKGINLD
jgi:hypothetical protein